DPICSGAASGARSDEFANTNGQECFGPNSAFALLHRVNAWIMGFACSFDRATFVHYVEKNAGVDYRHDKLFHGIIKNERRENERTEAVYFVRNLARKTPTTLSALKERLQKHRRLTEA